MRCGAIHHVDQSGSQKRLRIVSSLLQFGADTDDRARGSVHQAADGGSLGVVRRFREGPEAAAGVFSGPTLLPRNIHPGSRLRSSAGRSNAAPFVGTAIGFALARGPLDIGLVLGALGLGMAAPFLAIAAAPGVVAYPRDQAGGWSGCDPSWAWRC